MYPKGAKMPSRGPDMKGLGRWNTWHNRFAILDPEYYIMMHSSTQNPGVCVDTSYEPSKHSSSVSSRGDDTYFDSSFPEIEEQLLPVENNAQITSESEEGLKDGAAAIYERPFPSNNANVSSERVTANYQSDLRLNNEPCAQYKKPRVERTRLGAWDVTLNPERSISGASYTLNLLQNYCHSRGPRGHGWDEYWPRGMTNRLARLSVVARGMCRKPGEVLALCLEVQRNTLTVITQIQLDGNDAERGLHTVGENESTNLPVDDDTRRFVQHVHL